MKRAVPVIVTAVALFAGLGAVQLPTSRPQEPLPPGHPPVTTAPAATPSHQPPGPARADDVRDPDGLIAAYYACISGRSGVPRDWARFQSLFMPGATLVSGTSGLGDGSPIVLSPDRYAAMNDKYFVSAGYTEQSVRERTDTYGQIAHVWSTYESRRGVENDAYSRGVNCFQLLHTSHRWWIVSVVWDRERPGITPPP